MNRKQTVLIILLGLAAGVTGGYLINQLSQKSVKAEQFFLVDRKGKIHAILGLTNLGEPSLGIWDENGNNRVILGFIREGVTGLGLNDQNGKRRANIELDANGEPALVLFDKNGQRTWAAPQQR